MMWAVIIVMVVSSIGIYVCKKNLDRHPRVLSILLFFLFNLISSTICLLYYSGVIGNFRETKLRKREYSYSATRAYEILKYLKNEGKEDSKLSKAVICAIKGYENDQRSLTLINTIVELLEPDIKTVVEEVQTYDGKAPSCEQLTAFDFDRVINKHKDSDIIISTIGLPENFDEMDLFNGKWRKNVKVIIIAGNPWLLQNHIACGQIDLLIINRINAKITAAPIPEDPYVAYNERYLTLTPHNIDAIKLKYKRLFFE